MPTNLYLYGFYENCEKSRKLNLSLWEQKVVGSNPATPTQNRSLIERFFYLRIVQIQTSNYLYLKYFITLNLDNFAFEYGSLYDNLGAFGRRLQNGY